MKAAFYIAFALSTLLLLALTGIAFMQAGDFKYFNKKNRLISYFFVSMILTTCFASAIVLFRIDF